MATSQSPIPISSAGRTRALGELQHALEQVMSATEQGRAQAAVPVLEAALAAAKNSHDRDVIQMGLGVTMVRNCLVEGRVGPARRYAGVTLRDIERHLR